MAAGDPEEYERIITGAHIGISGFGGAFLAMVGLKFFFDADKDVRRFETSPEAIMELMTGGVDAAVIDMPVALYYRDRYPGFKLVVDPSEWL